MAIINLQVPFAEIRGTLAKQGIIHRRKNYKDDNGKVIFQGPQTPIDPATRKRKQYHTLNTFIRALTIQTLKAQNG